MYLWRCSMRVLLKSWMASVEYWFWWLSRITHIELRKLADFAIRSSSPHLTTVVTICVRDGHSSCANNWWLSYMKMTLKYETTDINIETGSSRAVLNIETTFWYSSIKSPQPILLHFLCRSESFKAILVPEEWECSQDSIRSLTTLYFSSLYMLFLFLLNEIQC